MDEYDDSEERDSEDDEADGQLPPAEGETVSRAQYEKAVKEARSLRTKLRRTEMEAEFGAEVLEMIPADLPLKQQKALAGTIKTKLDALTAQATPADGSAENSDADQGQPTEEEQRLAAVTSAGSTGTQTGQIYSAKEWAALSKVDPVQGQKLLEQGRVDMAGIKAGLGPDR